MGVKIRFEPVPTPFLSQTWNYFSIEKGMKMLNGALSGITVLDLSRMIPGPYCSMVLADHGARVIAIEDNRFKADLLIDTLNRNKEHMSLNLKTEEGKAIFFKLARKSDIIIEGFRPGVVRKLGIDYDAVKEVNPKIIYCAITGYGQSGPNRDRAGHDINYLSTTGILPLMGDPKNIPEVPRVQLGDIAAGGMNAAIGILMALHAREKTGKGQFIDISMSDGLLGFLSFPLNNKQQQKHGEQSVNAQAPESFACYHIYETSDGRCITIGAVEKRFWEKLCLHLNAPQYIDLQYSEEHSDEILEFMKNRFREKPADEWEKELNPLDVCFSKVQTLDEVLCDPFFKERDMVVEMERENGGKNLVLGIPIRLSETPGTIRSAPKQFGESTIAILKEVGYSEEKIEELAGMDVF